MSNNDMTTGLHTTGIMTDEAGTITGDVEVCSTCDANNHATATVRYKDAAEWYTITDAAQTLTGADQLPIYHTKLIGKYTG